MTGNVQTRLPCEVCGREAVCVVQHCALVQTALLRNEYHPLGGPHPRCANHPLASQVVHLGWELMPWGGP